MGRAKAAMMEHEENVNRATSFLIKIGVLQTCQVHGTIFDKDGDIDRAYPIAMSEKKKGENGLLYWAEDLENREVTDLIKEAYETHCGDICYSCEKIREE